MRSVILGLGLTVLFASASFAQVRLAVETCDIKPGEVGAFEEAIGDVVEYLTANPGDLPGTFYGGFREVAAPGDRVTYVLEVDGLGEFEDFILARVEANASDEQRGALFRAARSHIDEQSCNWSWPLTINGTKNYANAHTARHRVAHDPVRTRPCPLIS